MAVLLQTLKRVCFLVALIAGMGVVGSVAAHAVSIFGDPTLLEQGTVLRVRVIPESVAPGEKVLATVRANVSLERATIVWFVDGEEVTRGAGLTRTTLPMPNRYGHAEVQARALFPNGETAEGVARVSLAQITVVWEGRTYTFPTYQGRPKPVPQSAVAAHAFAVIVEDGKVVPPEDIVFSWYTRGEGVAPIVGVGRDSVVLPERLFGHRLELTVTATAPKGTRARTTVSIPFAKPRLLFYERHPLLGMRYDRYANPLSTTRDSITVVAEPLYFAVERRTDPSLLYFWEHDGAPARAKGPSIVIAREGEGPATANLSLYVEHESKVRQDAKGRYVVSFKGE